jgi:hypothetical protein
MRNVLNRSALIAIIAAVGFAGTATVPSASQAKPKRPAVIQRIFLTSYDGGGKGCTTAGGTNLADGHGMAVEYSNGDTATFDCYNGTLCINYTVKATGEHKSSCAASFKRDHERGPSQTRPAGGSTIKS